MNERGNGYARWYCYMKMKMENGYIYIVEANAMQSAVIKSWQQMKWNKKNRWWAGFASLELLDKLSRLVTLPEPINAERCHMAAVQEAVDRERIKPAEEVKPLVDYPVKKELYSHQVRAANMAMITFGLVNPPDQETEGLAR